MSFSGSALIAVLFRQALTAMVIGAIAASAAVIAPVTNSARADAHARQSVRTGVTAREIARISARPLILLADQSLAVSGAFATQGFLSEQARRVDAAARAAAKVKAEHEAAVAAEAAAAAAAAAVAEKAAADAAAQAAADAAARAAADAAAQAAGAAAQAAAAQAAVQANARSAADAVAAAAQGFVQRVWTSGFQNEINQCRGAVDVTAVYKVRVIAEHSNCGGSSFPTAAGAIVTITGLDAGRYRVIGVVAHLNGEVNHAEDIPRGYDLLFQTCVGGFTNMRFTALQRIG